MKDLVSIIIPYFKKKFFFKETINSILNQSYKNYEVILIYDDIDKSEIKYVKYILKKIKRKKIIINKKNVGAGMSRNIGIKASKGKFIAFLDADDLWHKNKIKNQIDFMKEKKINFSYCGYQIISKSKKFIKKIISPKKVTFQKLLYACDIGLSTVILKSNLLKSNKFSSLKTKEDYLLWLALSKKNIIMLGLDKNLVSWRKTDNSLSESTIQKLKDAFLIYNKHLKFNFIKSIYHVIFLSLNFFRKRYL
jgi:teichuronic acid biosynthesis glycosyltransferase TuaG